MIVLLYYSNQYNQLVSKIIQEKQNLMTTEAGKQLMQDMLRRVISDRGGWNKHVSKSCCKCDNCTCGKHKCLIKSPHLYLTPSHSTYNRQYQKKKPINQGNKNQNYSLDTYQPRQIIDKSKYKDEYRDKIKETVQPKKQIHHDNLQIGGPTFNKTTYQNSYTTIVGSPAQQIKNPQNLSCNPEVRMHTISNYRQTYKWHPKDKIRKQKPIIQQNNLKTEISHFTTQSRYATDYHDFKNYKRDKSNFAPDRSFQSQKGLNPQTSYNSHYSYKKSDPCPAATCC